MKFRIKSRTTLQRFDSSQEMKELRENLWEDLDEIVRDNDDDRLRELIAACATDPEEVIDSQLKMDGGKILCLIASAALAECYYRRLKEREK